MGSCVIFCAAEFDRLVLPIGAEDYIIAADGGLRHVEGLGLRANDILGDFDSLGYVPENSLVYPVEKDDTDTLLAIRRGLALGYTQFFLYGGMDGKRLDHTIANFQALKFLAERGAVGILVGREYLACVFGGGSLVFPQGAEGDFSLFCLGSDAAGVSIRGLAYPLTEGVLTSGFPLGVSNHFTGARAEISVRDGFLLALWQRRAGLPLEISGRRLSHGL